MRTDFTPRLEYTIAAIGVGAVSLGYGVYKDIKAGSADKKAAAEGASLKRPFEQVQNEYIQNQNLAKEQATTGLPVDVQNYLQSQRKTIRVNTNSIATGGSQPQRDYAKSNRLFDESLQSEGATMAQQHLANMQYLANVNKDIAGQKTTSWGVNEYQPFESKLQEIQNRRIAAQKNENEAGAQIVGSLGSIATSVNSIRPTGNNGGGDPGNVYGAGGNPNDVSVASSGSPDVAGNAPALNSLDLNI